MGAVCATLCPPTGADEKHELKDMPVSVLDAHDLPMIQPKKSSTVPLTIMVVGARWIKSSDLPARTGQLRCFLEVTCAGNRIYTTEVTQTSTQPQWAEEFEVKEYTENDEFEFKVYSIDLLGEADMKYNFSYHGKVLLKPHHYAARGFNGEIMMDEAGDSRQSYLGLRIKTAGREYPSGPPTTFTVVVEKGEHQNYGVSFDTSDKRALMVFRVHDKGAVAEHNRNSKPSEQLLQTDFIMSVNGVSSPLARIRQLRKSQVTCVVRRGIQVS
eukprot:CAMPEP_0172857648 /NCGR_PEP_ID=MMETSP1075-20121228/64748_1 /TAXON_ID=2916 /ORGANISM="Ceratium fusus, Strain PA161109" /LENGTH=269 /DNA_ID=CAMNT_0013705017 /DNA_START=14 /DNA_END=819 /DNA_ORIENTATION=-